MDSNGHWTVELNVDVTLSSSEGSTNYSDFLCDRHRIDKFLQAHEIFSVRFFIYTVPMSMLKYPVMSKYSSAQPCPNVHVSNYVQVCPTTLGLLFL